MYRFPKQTVSICLVLLAAYSSGTPLGRVFFCLNLFQRFSLARCFITNESRALNNTNKNIITSYARLSCLYFFKFRLPFAYANAFQVGQLSNLQTLLVLLAAYSSGTPLGRVFCLNLFPRFSLARRRAFWNLFTNSSAQASLRSSGTPLGRALHTKALVDFNHGFFRAFFINQAGNFNFRCADCLNVDAEFIQHFEKF